MKYDDLVDKFRNMEPLNRRFTAAAMGVGIGAVIIPIPGVVGFVATFAAAFAASRFFGNAAPNPENPLGRDMPEYLKNVGSMLAGTVAGVMVAGALLGTGAAPEDQEPKVIGPQGSLLEDAAEQAPVQLAKAHEAQPVLTYQPV